MQAAEQNLLPPTDHPDGALQDRASLPAIEVRDLRVEFGDLVVLEQASLTVGGGEFVSLLGPSGCGKTTLLNVLGDLVSYTSGEVRVLGGTPAEARRQRQIGYVFQAPTLLPWRRVRDNARLLAEIVGADRASVDARLARLLDAVGLAEFDRNLPSELSGGMQQRLAIVRMLAFDPGLLLMDEPFAALDALTRDRMGEMLLDVWGGDKPIIFVTHSIEEAAFLSDRVIVMSARPARVLEEVVVPLARPREHEMKRGQEFFEIVAKLRLLIDAAQGDPSGGHL